MSMLSNEIKILNENIVSAHNKHYENSPTGLIIPNEAPNGNTIYHLYSDGEITWQKGGSVYLQRSEFTDWNNPTITGYEKLKLKLPNKTETGYSYAILTQEECINFRKKMVALIDFIDIHPLK